MAFGYSPQLPLSSTTTHYKMINEFPANIRQNLKNLLLTSPGERVMLPDFGVGIRRYLFEHSADEVISELRDNILEQVATYMDFVYIDDIMFATKADDEDLQDNELAIKIIYSVSFLDLSDSLIIAA